MQTPLPHIKHFSNQNTADIAVADALANAIAKAVSERGKASVLLSGGTTPKNAYRLLFDHDLPWEHVVIVPVDDRWVPENDTGSNYGMMRALLKNSRANKAKLLNLVPMAPFDESMLHGIKGMMIDICPDVCLMGMGTDGHTASWFPNSRGLETAIHSDLDCAVTGVDAAGCPGAGDYPNRITFTMPVILKAKHIVLFLTGQKKACVLKESMCKLVTDAPVKALFDAGSRLEVMWAP